MVSKKERTIEMYMKAGAEMRLFKTLGVRLMVDISKVLLAKEQDKLMRALKIIDDVCLKAETNMFHDYPHLKDEYTDVFYGKIENESRNDVDMKILKMAKEIVDEFFEGKNG